MDTKPATQRTARIVKGLFTGAYILFMAIPLFLLLLWGGWPPVIGNLAAAWTIERYAAQAHPDWTADSHWASYCLPDSQYSLPFEGVNSHSLGYDRTERGILDTSRSRAAERELDLPATLAQLNAEQYNLDCRVNLFWSPKEPDQPFAKLTVDLVDGANAPTPDKGAIREKMADRAMTAYERLSPIVPVRSLTVRYAH